MAGLKISELTDGVGIGSADSLVAVRSGADFKIQANRLTNNTWLVGRNQAGTGDVNMLRLNTNNQVEFGAGQTILGGAVPTDFHPDFQAIGGYTRNLFLSKSAGATQQRFAAAIQNEQTGFSASNDVNGAWIQAIANHTGAQTPGIVGSYIEGINYGPAAAALVGGYFFCQHHGSGAVGYAAGIYVIPFRNDGGGTITDAHGILVDQLNSFGSLGGQHYALRIYNQGATNWSIVSEGGKIRFLGLPTVDPHVVGQLWNNAGVLTVSAG
jgi:hypothetical protein